MSKSEGSASTVQSLDRAVHLLDIIAEADGLSLSHISRQAGLAPSTAHRILTTLESHRLVHQDEDRNVWLIGVKAFQIGNAFLRNRRVAVVARPIMREIMESTGESVSLAIGDDDAAVFIAQYECHSPVRTFHRPGSRGAMHASAAGKALLAGQGDRAIRQFLQRAGLPRFTAKTITDPDAFEQELRVAHQRGWAVDDEERAIGMRCVGAPIHDEHGEVLAAVSVSGPTVRMTEEQMLEFGPLVKRFAHRITQAIGGSPLALTT